MLPIRIVAAFLALLSVFPLWRVLPSRATGLAGAATADAAAAYSAIMLYGAVIAAIPGIIAAMLLKSEILEQFLARIAAPLEKPTRRTYAFVIAFLAFGASAFVAIVIMDGRATLIDSFAQLTQARYMAAGRLAGPADIAQQAWIIPQTIVTHGWVSQYPPGYSALLAIGFKSGAVTLVGPALFAVTAFFTALIAEKVIANRALARVAALLAALSPFMLGQAGAFMSHVPAAAFSSAALYFVLRAKPLPAGLAIGALFTVRPLTAVVTGIVALVYVAVDRRPLKKRLIDVGGALIAAAPFALFVMWYNAHFFGSATTFGYDAALGPAAGLGFGQDPWGNAYGIVEALAYTSADLAALSVYLLETPLPLVALVGLFMVLTPQLPAQARLLFWWTAALIIAYLFYWHHGMFMGPRMLADTGTLWVLLVVMAVAGLIARVPSDWMIANRYSGRSFAVGAVTASLLLGVLVLTPSRLFSYAPPSDVQALLRAPRIERPALVFVHGGWTSRINARLAAAGMRLDSIETALRQNGTCSVHHFALQYAAGHTPAVRLDFAPRAEKLPQSLEISPGNRIRVQQNERIDAECVQQAAADKAGVVDVAPYIWQGDLPGLAVAGGLFVRDMGPADNARLIAANADRVPLMLDEREGRLHLLSYEDGMRARWGVAQ